MVIYGLLFPCWTKFFFAFSWNNTQDHESWCSPVSYHQRFFFVLCFFRCLWRKLGSSAFWCLVSPFLTAILSKEFHWSQPPNFLFTSPKQDLKILSLGIESICNGRILTWTIWHRTKLMKNERIKPKHFGGAIYKQLPSRRCAFFLSSPFLCIRQMKWPVIRWAQISPVHPCYIC